MYSVFALLLMRQFMNCLYVVGDYRAAGIAVNMPILAHIHYNQFLRRFQNVRSIYLQILLRSDSEITTRGYPRRDNLLHIFTEPISYGEKE